MIKRSKLLSMKFVLYLIGSFGVILLLSNLVLFMNTKATTEKMIDDSTRQLAENTRDVVDGMLREKATLVDSVASAIKYNPGDILVNRGELNRIFKDIQVKQAYSGSKAIYMGMESDGAFVTSNDYFLPPGSDMRSRPWYRKALTADKPLFTEPYITFGTKGEMNISVVRQVRGSQDELLGVTGMSFDLEQLRSSVGSVSVSGGKGYWILIDAAGNYIYHPRYTLADNVMQADGGELAPLLPKLLAENMTFQDYKGCRYISISLLPTVDWRLIAVIPQGAIQQLIYKELWGVANVSLLLIVVILLLIPFLIQSLTKPLDEVVAHLLEISKGNFSRRLPERTLLRQDEIGKVAKAVEYMQQKRQEVEELLRESEERYKAIMEQSFDAVAILELDTLALLEVNRQWLKMFGCSRQECAKLTLYDLSMYSADRVNKFQKRVLYERYLKPQFAKFRKKNGQVFEVERTAAIVFIKGRNVIVVTARDISAEQRLQQQITDDANLAARIQRDLLPTGFNDAVVRIETIYSPYRVVSGDFYDYVWSSDRSRLSGFVLDAAGHGIASSLQGVMVSTLFRESFDSSMSLAERVDWINQQVYSYFTEDMFAAAVCFEFDFSCQQLTFVMAGIYQCLAASAELPHLFKKAGSLIGVSEHPEYTEHRITIQPGDAFYFMTDGISEYLHSSEALQPRAFDKTVATLRNVAMNPDKLDDCSALCIQIAGKPSYPLRFRLSRPSDRAHVRSRIRNIFEERIGQDASKIEIVLGEALNNALRQGMEVQIKVNFIGSKMVLRVKDHGKGFAGNSYLKQLQEQRSDAIFHERLFQEGGRGILIMQAWMDRVLYNRTGNEVLLVKKIE